MNENCLVSYKTAYVLKLEDIEVVTRPRMVDPPLRVHLNLVDAAVCVAIFIKKEGRERESKHV
jgi:hypothetical protein